MRPSRRTFLISGAAVLAALAIVRAQSPMRVVVVGGGFGGATCSRYLKLWAPQLDVTLVESQAVYVACPLSNRVLSGTFFLRELAREYGHLASDYRVRIVRASAVGIDAAKRTIALNNGTTLPWDKLVLSPGIEFADERIAGLPAALESTAVLHAWRGGARQISALRDRVAELRSGGVIALHIPKAPFRCPPGPYERVSLIAHYLSRNNPKAKLLVFDANPDILAKRDLFMELWKTRHAGLIKYPPNAELTTVSNEGRQLEFQMQGRVPADVAYIIPPQRAPAWMRRADLAPTGADRRRLVSGRFPHLRVHARTKRSCAG
jgi:NADPH-dependent 2,4-dienoyl-CoA reductase/sulfur reductase-like enzyme